MLSKRNAPPVARLLFSERFADDLSRVETAKLEQRILENLKNIERFGDIGSSLVPKSIKRDFGSNVRKIAVNPFDLVYTYYPESDTAYVEALVHQRAAF